MCVSAGYDPEMNYVKSELIVMFRLTLFALRQCFFIIFCLFNKNKKYGVSHLT
jgi:hypothetical protein